jgi:class 3 adenylate cyclase
MKRQITLLQRFSIVTLATTLIIGAWLGYQVTSSIEQAAVERARNDLAEAVRSRRPFWLETANPSSEFARLHNSPQDYDNWKNSTDAMLAGYPIYRIKVWNTASQIIWSDDPSVIGQVHAENEELEEALEGNVESEIADLSKIENAGGVEGRLLELYVPILPRNSFEVIGVFEVYEDISDMYDTVGSAQRDAWLLIGSLMGAFYVVLFVTTANASRTLSRLQRVAQLERYFSPAVAQAISSMNGMSRRDGTPLTARVVATVMFTDIRGFTRHTEDMEPEDVVTLLSDYVDLVTRAVFRYGGSVDKFLGDGVLAVFGAPLAQPDHAGSALRAAEEIRHRLQEMNAARREQGERTIQVGTSLVTGEVITGTLGRAGQLAYTVVGDTVNLASRLVGLARPGEVLVTASTYVQAGATANMETFQFAGPFTLQVRGRNEPVTIFASPDPQAQLETPDETGFTLRNLPAPRRALAVRS